MKNHTSNAKKTIGALLAAVVILSLPTVGFAKENKGMLNFDANANAKANVQAKLDNEHSNSIFKRIAGIFKHDQEDENLTLAVSNLSAVSIRAHKATLTWNTNVKANSSVWISKTSPVSTTGLADIVKGKRVKNHKITLGHLDANTTYYVIVGSKAKNGTSITMSSQISFTTLSDSTIKPVISNISTTVTATGSTINWTTNEASTSKVFYGSTTPVNINLSGTSNVSSNVMTTSHSLSIPALTSATKYYYVIQSTDASANAGVSAEGSFTTLQ
jgi:hypothetical protein